MYVLLLALWVTTDGRAAQNAAQEAQGGESESILRLDPRLNELIPSDAVAERVADGFTWVEGPAWDKTHGHLLFSDIPGNAVYRWRKGESVSLFLKPSGYTGPSPFPGREPGSNGLSFDPHGRLVLCEHGDRRIARLEPNGSKKTLVDRYPGKRLNSPNDAVFRSNGVFTSPTPRSVCPEPFSGVYRLSARGDLTLLTPDIKAPNGIAFSPDEKTLYLTDVDPQRPAWLAYDVNPNGTLSNGRLFFDAAPWTRLKPGAPDGMKVDNHGNLLCWTGWCLRLLTGRNASWDH